MIIGLPHDEAGQQKLVEVRVQREIAVRELQSSVDLSLDRYLLGLSSYFEG